MYGMPLSQALLLLSTVVVLVAVTQWRPFHPLLAILLIATAFGLIAGYTTAQVGTVFGSGFAAMSYSPGLVIVAAGLIAGLSESTTACDRLTAFVDRRRGRGSNWIAGFCGLLGGVGASPASAFAILTPLLPAVGGETAHGRARAAVTVALAISASHGVVFLTPVPIAAAAILGADWDRVALFGLPLALVVVAFGAIFARWPSIYGVAAETTTTAPPAGAPKGNGGSAIALILATAVPLLMLIVQSVGDMPSEPLGGGPARELVLGVGRPLLLFLVGVGIMVASQMRRSLGLLADSAWTSRIFGNVGGILLTVCAAGGLQRLCQQTGMAEMFGERFLGWPMGTAFGVLIPFLVATAMKTLQGSSLVAAIAAAGMVQPLLLPLGLADANGRALAALAVGAGAMTVCHINDEYFWLVAANAKLSPLRGLTAISLGTLLQGLVAVAALLILSLVVSHV